MKLNACGKECFDTRDAEIKKPLGKPMYEASDGWVETAPVGTYEGGASAFGIFDMAGNVWEWTADWHGPYAAAATLQAPKGPETPEIQDSRVNRGGGWFMPNPSGVRAANRSGVALTVNYSNVGFRCARGPNQ